MPPWGGGFLTQQGPKWPLRVGFLFLLCGRWPSCGRCGVRGARPLVLWLACVCYADTGALVALPVPR